MSSEEKTATGDDTGSLLYSDESDTLDERNRRKINDIDQRVQKMEDAYLGRIRELEDEVSTLRQEVNRVDERTDLLKHVTNASQKPVDERASILLQRMYADAVDDPNRMAEYDYDRTDTLVGSGFSSRSPVYNTMKRAAELVDDEDLVWYDKQPKHSDKPTTVRLDLKAGDLPRRFKPESVSSETQTSAVSRDDDTDDRIDSRSAKDSDAEYNSNRI